MDSMFRPQWSPMALQCLCLTKQAALLIMHDRVIAETKETETLGIYMPSLRVCFGIGLC